MRPAPRWIAAAALVLPGMLGAQGVRGVVVDAGNTPMTGVVIQLLTASDSVAGRALSNAHGEFLVTTPRAGEYRVRTLRIGFKPVTSEVITLRAGEELSRRFEIAGVAVALSGVTIEGESVCRRSANDSASAAFTAWDQLRTAIAATQITAISRGMTVTTIDYARSLDPLGRTVLSDEATVRTEQVRQPWAERRADLVRREGYVVEDQAGNFNYHVPGLEALGSTHFLEDHCLRVSPLSTPTRLGIAFEPNADRRGVPEVRGTAWLDRETSELRTVDYAYVNLAAERQDLAGGSIEFTRMTDGTWVISRWHVRMPVLEQVVRDNSMGGVQRRLAELHETGAQLTIARRGTDTLWSRAPLPLSGTVTDSATSRPVAGAVAMLVGTTWLDTSDARGRFTIHAVPGEYTLEVRTPSLDSVKTVHQSRVTFIDAAVPLNVKVPDGAAIRRLLAARDRAVFAGTIVLDSTDQPIRDVEISFPGLSKTVKSDSNGAFRIADVPAGTHRVLVRRIGYGVYDAPVYFMAGRIVQRKIELPRITELETARITTDAATANLPLSFEENRRLGLGHFTTREQLDRLGGMTLQTALDQTPGLGLVLGRQRQAWILSKRAPPSHGNPCSRPQTRYYCPTGYESAKGVPVACYARVYIDKMLMNAELVAEPFDVNSIPPHQVEAMEFYASAAQTPAEYSRLNSACGVLVIHTRR